MQTFPNLDWFKTYAARLEKDEDFRTHGRWFRGAIAFRVDSHAVTVVFDDGIVTDVREGMRDADFVINGSSECWDRLVNQDITLLRMYRSAQIEIRGRNTELMKNWKAIFWIAQGMKLMGQPTGG